MSDPGERDGSWTLLTGHGHVLVEIARNPGARIRDISAAAGITERTVQAIVADLEAAGYLTRRPSPVRSRSPSTPSSADGQTPVPAQRAEPSASFRSMYCPEGHYAPLASRSPSP